MALESFLRTARSAVARASAGAVGLLGGAALALPRRRAGKARAGSRADETAEQLVATHDRELAGVAAISRALARAGNAEAIGRALLEEVCALVPVQFTALALVDEDRGEACGLLARQSGEEVAWWKDVRLDLEGERSGIAAAARDRASLTVTDAEESPIVARRLVEAVGARSAAFVPMLADTRVTGVLVAATTLDRHEFRPEELHLMEALAGEAALALERARSGAALAEALKENEERLRDSIRQEQITRGFYRIASVLAHPLSLEETLDAVAQAASEALGGAFAAVLMPGRNGLRLAGSYELPAPLASALEDGLPEAAEALAHCAATRRVLAAARIHDDDRFGREWRALAEGTFRSLLAAPLEAPRSEDGGLAIVFFEDERTFSDEDLDLTQHLAGAARGALDRSALYETERAARALSQQLARIGTLLATELDPEAVLREVVEQARVLLAADACAISVPSGEDLVVRAAEGQGAAAAIGSRAPSTARLAGDVVHSGSPVVVSSIDDGGALAESDRMLAAGYRAYLGVPLAAPDAGGYGVLAVYTLAEREWRSEEIDAMQALAGNASAALANAELYQRVALEKERSEAILGSVADGIVAVGRDEKVVLWNAAAEQITGVPAEDALGKTPVEVLQKNLALEGDMPPRDRLISILRGGEEVWLSVTEAVMRDAAGGVAGRVFAFRDVSSERLVEQMKSDFVSTVSHELRAPLTSIFGFAETLLRQDVLFGDEERRTFIRYIASEAQRLTKIVDELLNVARLDAGDLQVNLEPTDVRPVVSEAVSRAEELGRMNAHRFVVELPSEPLAAEADRDKLRQILGHLIDNAVKYSPEGGTVTVAARQKKDSVEVRVVDEGIGIPQAEQELIFSKFYRRPDPFPREGGAGPGVGLFIARGLVAAMGGRISVSSVEGEGSSFVLELPLARDAGVDYARAT